MSKARYITAMSLFGALFLVSTLVGVIFGDDLWVGLLSGYGMGVTVAELIFWRDSLCTRLFLFFANIAKTIVLFWITFFVVCIPILFFTFVHCFTSWLAGFVYWTMVHGIWLQISKKIMKIH